MSQAINKAYSLAALMIHATKQEVTKEKIVAVLTMLGIQHSLKIASMFEISSQKYTDMLSNTGSAAPVAASSSQNSTSNAKAQEIVEEKEDESESDNVIGF